MQFTFHYASTYTSVNSTTTKQLKTFTFHYASTYTSDASATVSVVNTIYIPLCFYLYVDTSVIICDGILIYIPLCFYLYHDNHFYHFACNLFTFHYASTYTYNGVALDYMEINLHSTMLLLILGLSTFRRQSMS